MCILTIKQHITKEYYINYKFLVILHNLKAKKGSKGKSLQKVIYLLNKKTDYK